MVLLLNYNFNILINLFGILVGQVGVKAANICGKLGFYNGHGYLALVRDMQVRHLSTSARFLYIVSKLVVGPNLAVL